MMITWNVRANKSVSVTATMEINSNVPCMTDTGPSSKDEYVLVVGQVVVVVGVDVVVVIRVVVDSFVDIVVVVRIAILVALHKDVALVQNGVNLNTHCDDFVVETINEETPDPGVVLVVTVVSVHLQKK